MLACFKGPIHTRLCRPPALPQPAPSELPNPLPLATRQYVALALHTAVQNTR